MNEIQNSKHYDLEERTFEFYDLGVRNAVIDDFTSIENRKDFGALWENFCIMERMKHNDAVGRPVNYCLMYTVLSLSAENKF